MTLAEYLLNKFPDARYASGNKEIVMRCRFCGDSQKDKSARHLYIKVDGNIPFYNCFKCNASGVLTSDVIRNMSSSYNPEDEEVFRALDKKIKKESSELRYTKQNNIYRVFNTYVEDNELSRNKLQYINNRLGLNLSYQNILYDKIVLNLNDLLKSNNITKFTRDHRIINTLSDVSIGFLSMDNSTVIMRNMAKGKLHPSIDNRYNKYSIFSNDNSNKYYTIPTSVDLLNPEPIHIHIAEGTFDILSIFYNLRSANRFQNVYTAVCGKAYFNVIKMWLQDYGFINSIIHLYPDNDVNDRFLFNDIKVLKNIDIPIYIHRNIFKDQKDMGVSIDKIRESVKRL